MYSSGMRTARLLTVSQHALGRGVCIPACTGQGGVYPGGVYTKGVSAQGGVCGRHSGPCKQNDRQV